MITLTAHDLMEVCLKYIPHSDTNVKVWQMEIDYFQCTAGEYFIEGSVSPISGTKIVRVLRPKKSKRYFNATLTKFIINVYNVDVETAREVKVNKGFDEISDVMERPTEIRVIVDTKIPTLDPKDGTLYYMIDKGDCGCEASGEKPQVFDQFHVTTERGDERIFDSWRDVVKFFDKLAVATELDIYCESF